MDQTRMKNTKERRGRARVSRAAFTIVEIIVVIVIIGILATLVAPRLLSRIGMAKTSTAQSNAASLANAVQNMGADVGGLNSGWTIRALWERPADVPDGAWKGPYVQNEEALKDPWGHEFMLVIPGRKNVDFDVISYGADGNDGGEGDNADIIKP